MSKSCKRLPVKSLFTAALYFFLVASSFVFRCQFDNGRGRQSLVLVFRLENGVADLHVVTLVVERIRSHSFFVCLTSATFAVNAQKRSSHFVSPSAFVRYTRSELQPKGGEFYGLGNEFGICC